MSVSTAFRVTLLLSLATPCVHAQFSNIYVFGDSLSDIGNVFSATGGFIPADPPYFQGRFSDGPLWVEQLAERLDLPIVPNGPDPNEILGNNFAAAGARTAVDIPVPLLGTIPSVLTQVAGFLQGTEETTPDALYVIYSGSNDLRLAVDPDGALGDADRQQLVEDTVDGIATAISNLANSGAESFLVPNIADLGVTPDARIVRQNATESNEISVEFNRLLADALNQIETSLSVEIYRLDTFEITNQVVRDANDNGGQQFGIENVEVPIFPGFAGSTGADPLTSLFADDLHISGVANELLGDFAFALVPEPSALRSAMIGLLILTAAARRLRAGNYSSSAIGVGSSSTGVGRPEWSRICSFGSMPRQR